MTADDVEGLQLETDLAAFGTKSLALVREEYGDEGEPDATTRSARQRTVQQFAADHAPLVVDGVQLQHLKACLDTESRPEELANHHEVIPDQRRRFDGRYCHARH